MRYLGIIIALFAGINTEYFAQRGAIGIVTYILLIVAAVGLAMIRRRKE